VKVLYCDRTGVCVFYKRLDAGTFRVPEPAMVGDAARMIDERALDDLLDGIDLDPVSRRRITH
jgi:transposase